MTGRWLPPPTTSRGAVSRYLHSHRGLLASPVLEIGSRGAAGAWWADIRGQIGAGLEWVGVDMQPGVGVDLVMDAERLDFPPASFECAVAAEVLEHVRDPRAALAEVHRVLRPGAWLLVTTVFAHHEHGFPSDYWRFSRSGLALLMEQAGFVDVITEYDEAPEHTMVYHLRDHDERTSIVRTPVHVFGRGRA